MPAPARRPARRTQAGPAAKRPIKAETEPTPEDRIVVSGTIDQGEPETTTQAGGLRTKDGAALQKATVVAAGRTFSVSIPGEAQLAIMRRFADRYGNVNGEIPFEQGVTMTDAAISVIQAVIDEQADKRWVETALLAGEVTLEDLQPIVDIGMKNLIDANSNREQRRAADKGPRAKRATLAMPA